MYIMKNQNTPKIAVIGFGEAGSSLCKGWGLSDVRAFDIKQHGDALLAAEKVAQMSAAGVIIGDDAADVANDANIIFCTVTADQAYAAASAVAKAIKPGAYYLDLNSCALPLSKKMQP